MVNFAVSRQFVVHFGERINNNSNNNRRWPLTPTQPPFILWKDNDKEKQLWIQCKALGDAAMLERIESAKSDVKGKGNGWLYYGCYIGTKMLFRLLDNSFMRLLIHFVTDIPQGPRIEGGVRQDVLDPLQNSSHEMQMVIVLLQTYACTTIICQHTPPYVSIRRLFKPTSMHADHIEKK